MAARARKDPDDGELRLRFPKEPCDQCSSLTQWANRSGYRVCPDCMFKEAFPIFFGVIPPKRPIEDVVNEINAEIRAKYAARKVIDGGKGAA